MPQLAVSFGEQDCFRFLSGIKLLAIVDVIAPSIVGGWS
jgi:hypothetical protein